jgi:hypothetical protein
MAKDRKDAPADAELIIDVSPNADTATQAAPPAPTTPVVYYVRGGGRKKKRRTTRGLRDVQNFERGVTRSGETLSRAIMRGLKRYDRLRDKSSRKKRDGAIRDALDNWSRAAGRALRVASDAPYDFTKEINTKRFSRQLRDTVRMFSLPIFR